VVDTLLGEFQTVIKPLGKVFSHIRCISGSTILGTGEVALILDVPALVQQIELAGASMPKSGGRSGAQGQEAEVHPSSKTAGLGIN
jgi:chemotaxis protein histidine kinase CheA